MSYKETFFKELLKLGITPPNNYINSNTKVSIVGTCGHEIVRTPDKILRTIKSTGKLKCTACSRKKDKSFFDIEQKKIEDELESYGCKLISKYSGAKNKIKIIAECGHELERKINHIRYSKRDSGSILCRSCAYKKAGKSRRNTKDAIAMFLEEYGARLLSEVKTEHDDIELIGSCGHVFTRRLQEVKKSADSIGRVICQKCSMTDRSNGEKELSDYIKSLGFDVIDNFRPGGTRGFEADVFVPSKMIAFEYHGLNWHSDRVLSSKGINPKKYHLEKTKFFSDNGIMLIHIFENEWKYKRDIIKSIISSKLGVSKERVYARKCTISEISKKDANEFLKRTHRQGASNSSMSIGMFYHDRLISVMTFGKPRFSKKYDIELLRFSSELNTVVVGGFSKMLSYYIRNNNFSKMVSYADVRYSGIDPRKTVYCKNGFSLDGISQPNYFYFKRGGDKLMSRMRFQKHKLPNELKIFDSSLTEYQNMVANGYDRIFDCGNMVFSM